MKLAWAQPDFEALVAGTQQTCPFCPDKVFGITPLFPPEILPEGRLVLGDMVLFPNLAPYDSLGAVATLGSRHYLPMDEIEPQRIANGFRLALDFFKRIQASGHEEAVYNIINWNYMPPAGSSLIHPHLQVFASSSAPNLMREELQAAQHYMDQNRSNFWDDLVKIEIKTGSRYLGTIGRTHWLTAFAPMGVAGDVLAVVDGVHCTLELSQNDIDDLAQGLTRTMCAYQPTGIYSFNMNFFTGKKGDAHARFHLLFSPRTFFNQTLGTPDIGALRNLFNETLCMAYPEEINSLLKEKF
jgi:galactose-1-phosphate uridylyltransferase